LTVAPDTSVPESGQAYFKVVIAMAKPYLGEADAGLGIMPGMGATVDIHTGSKSVVSFLLRPVLKLRAEAFRER